VSRNTLARVGPNQPKTPVRTFRVDDQRWDRVKAEAARLGVTASDLLREMIDERLPLEEDQG
jgi:predicted DNA-binding protein